MRPEKVIFSELISVKGFLELPKGFYMFWKKTCTILILLLLGTVAVWALPKENKIIGQQDYSILQSDNASYSKKKGAVKSLKEIWENSKDPIVLDVAIKLLTYNFDKEHFRENDQKMYNNDRIAQVLIELLGKTRSPESFRVLAIYVSKQNHTEATIRAAWKAIQNIDWSQTKSK